MIIELSLDIEKSDGRFTTLEDPITLRRQDSIAYVIEATIHQGAQAMDLTGYTVRFYARKPDGTIVADGDSVLVTSPADGVVQYPIPAQLTAAVGDISPCYFAITDPENGFSASTQNIAISVIQSVSMDIASNSYVPELDSALQVLEAERVAYALAEAQRETQWAAAYAEALSGIDNLNSAAASALDAQRQALAAADQAIAAARQAISAVTSQEHIYLGYEEVAGASMPTFFDDTSEEEE